MCHCQACLKKKRLDIKEYCREESDTKGHIDSFKDCLLKSFSSSGTSSKLLNSSLLSDDEKVGILIARFGLENVLKYVEAAKFNLLDQFSSDIVSQGLGVPKELCELFKSSPGVSSRLSRLSSSSTFSVGPSPGPAAAAAGASTCTSDVSAAKHTTLAGTGSVLLLPPCGNCVFCFGKLYQHHTFVDIKLFTTSGPRKGRKQSLRCKTCDIIYKYSVYGSTSTYWKLYSHPREAVEVSDCVFVERRLLELQCNLANHAWVSFVGFAESYNGTFNLTRHTGLTYKQVSSAFFSGELENELRSLDRLDMFNLLKVDGDRDKVLEQIEKLRRKKPYPHENCHAACKAKGCGRVFALDGIWKLRFPHCMYKVKSVVSKIEIPGLPDVCTNAPVRGKAFCQVHCATAEKSNMPTGLREFLKHCGVSTAESLQAESAEGGSDDPVECVPESQVSGSAISNVEDALSKLEPSSSGSSVVDAQGTSTFIEENSQHVQTIMAGCEEDKPSACKKDTGGRKTLQKWSRGHLFIVRGGGHIEYWQSLYRSESPSQVFLILLAWLAIHLKSVSPSEWSNLSLVYDNMCHLDNMRVARKPLPLPWPWSHMWMSPHKCIDRLHIRNHVDDDCKAKYHPDNHLQASDNTLSCEQTFVWLSRYKKIVCAMPKSHHLFYIHRMVVRRNAYTEQCYLHGYSPVLPVVKSSKTT